MPREAQGPRLWLREGKDGRQSTWVIKDGAARISTGLSEPDRAAADQALAVYIIEQHKPQRPGSQDPLKILVSDILNRYLLDVGMKHARPHETARRVMKLGEFFGLRTLGEMKGPLFREYAAERNAPSAARRELEDFRAAVSHFFIDELIPPKINVPMPEKAPPRERWLTHEEAAKLLWTAYKNTQDMPKGGKRYVSRHIARFILVALYTGTRASRICSATITPTEGRPYINLKTGQFYRRPPGEKITKKRAPTINLPLRLMSHIRRWAALGLCKNAIVEWEGQPVIRVSKGFRTIVEKAGLKDVTPHILRHTSITWAMQQGVAIHDAEDYYGATPKVMKDVYSHHHPDHNRDVGEKLTRRKRR